MSKLWTLKGLRFLQYEWVTSRQWSSIRSCFTSILTIRGRIYYLLVIWIPNAPRHPYCWWINSCTSLWMWYCKHRINYKPSQDFGPSTLPFWWQKRGSVSNRLWHACFEGWNGSPQSYKPNKWNWLCSEPQVLSIYGKSWWCCCASEKYMKDPVSLCWCLSISPYYCCGLTQTYLLK